MLVPMDPPQTALFAIGGQLLSVKHPVGILWECCGNCGNPVGMLVLSLLASSDLSNEQLLIC